VHGGEFSKFKLLKQELKDLREDVTKEIYEKKQ